MKNYIRNWSLMRLLRLGVGIFIIVQGVLMHEWMFIGLGALFTAMPVLNMGCGANGSCGVPRTRSTPNENREVTYTEV